MARAILEQRAKLDPCKAYKPGPTQLECLNSKARWRALLGSNRSGKTAHVAIEIAMAARRIHPTRSTSVNGVYLILAPSRDQLSDPWGKKLLKSSELMGDLFDKPMIPAHEIERVFHVHGAGQPTPREVLLKNGQRILFMVSDDPSSWIRAQGKGMILGIGVDEAAGSEQLMAECAARLLDANSHEKVRAEAGGGWMLWGVTPTMANSALDKYVERCEDQSEADYALFRISPSENPAIDPAEREKLRSMMDEDQFNIRMGGTGSQTGAMLVYPQFDERRHVLANDYVPTPNDNLWVGYDPGTNYTGIIFAAVSPDKPRQVKIVKCLQPRRQTLESDVVDIMNFLKGRFLEGFVYDQAARIQNKTGKSVLGVLTSLFKQNGVVIQRGLLMGDSIYERGIPLVRQFMDPDPNNPAADPYLVLNPSSESGCGRLRQQIRSYRFSKNAYLLKGDNIVRGDDHILDATRYLVSKRPSWVQRRPNTVDPRFSLQPKHDYRVKTEDELRDEAKRQASILISQGKLPEIRRRLR